MEKWEVKVWVEYELPNNQFGRISIPIKQYRNPKFKMITKYNNLELRGKVIYHRVKKRTCIYPYYIHARNMIHKHLYLNPKSQWLKRTILKLIREWLKQINGRLVDFWIEADNN